LKAGVYYTQKHEVIRIQKEFDVKLMVYELIKNDANSEFAQHQYDRACRKYEEALGCFRYYEATDPSW
jgi:tetratricopeptide (TPR) repeat protein